MNTADALSRVSLMARDVNGVRRVLSQTDSEALLIVLHSHAELLESVKNLRRIASYSCSCSDCRSASERADAIIARAEATT